MLQCTLPHLGAFLDDNGETEADSDPVEFSPRCLPIAGMLHI